VGQSRTLRTPTWCWILLAVSISAAFWIVWVEISRPAKVELLPFNDSPPAWNGSYPHLVISLLDSGSETTKFKSSIQDIVPTVRHDSPINEFEVDLHSGAFVLRQTDFFIPDSMPLSLTRTYRARETYGNTFDSLAFGVGTNHQYDVSPTGSRYPYTYMYLNLEDGRAIYFQRISKGTEFADAVFRHDETSSEFFGAQIAWNGNGWTLNFRDGRSFVFPENYNGKFFAQGAPIAMQDDSHHRIQLMRDKDRNLEKLISPAGHTITFKYDYANRIVDAVDDAGCERKYSYDPSGHLETVADASHVIYRFAYEQLNSTTGFDPYVMTSVMDGKGNMLIKNSYDSLGKITEQKLANGEIYHYDYLFNMQFKMIGVIVTGPKGTTKLSFHNGIATKNE
jgi:YD repeat-containing protein